MSEEKVLTREIAERIKTFGPVVNLEIFDSIDDDAAEILGSTNEWYSLSGLSKLTATQANSLSKTKG